MEYWFLCIAVGIPLLMFTANPESPRPWRIARTLIAFIAGYVLTMAAYAICYRYYPLGYSRIGAHWFVLGWLWTLTYIGWWELGWRIYYRRSLISIYKGIGDDWLNNKVLMISFAGSLLFLLIFMVPMVLMELNRHGITSL